MNPSEILIADYTYELPVELIAYDPLPERDLSRLLVYKSGRIEDDWFYHVDQYLPADSLLILNNTKVLEARILFTKASGGLIEIFCLEPYNQSMELALQQTASVQWKCLVGGASKWKPGQLLEKEIAIKGNSLKVTASFIEKLDDGFIIEFNWPSSGVSFVEILHAAGAIPLPPYIKRNAVTLDAERYQTIFGRHDGSVAAPTAALHFTEAVFERLSKKQIITDFVTLNVGAGTFKPVKATAMADHYMHGEDFTISKAVIEKIINAKQVIVAGTTSLRTLESVYWLGIKLITSKEKMDWQIGQWEVYELEGHLSYQESLQAIINWMNKEAIDTLHCRTSLLIVPGYAFKIPVALLTNFHQPQSTLLLLVAAFIGDDWKRVYEHALENGYRFLSYGDSSLLWRET